MAKDDNDQDERHPYELIAEKADTINFDDEEDREDWIEAKMRRAGYKKGPGAWVSVSDDDDDDGDHDDDDKPMTRGDWRKMQKERRKSQGSSYTPPRKPKTDEEKNKGGKGKTNNDAWW
jgi:hypothetical protein